MKKMLSAILAVLTLVVAFVACGYTAPVSNAAPVPMASTKVAAEQDNSLFAPVIRSFIEESSKERLKSSRTAYGTLYDLDGDGADELLIVYRRELDNIPMLLCDVYDIENGQVKAVLEKVEIFSEVGGDSGKVGAAEYDGNVYLYTSSKGGWTLNMQNSELTNLYDCAAGELYTSFRHKWFQEMNAQTDNKYSIESHSCSEADYRKEYSKVKFIDIIEMDKDSYSLDTLLKNLASGSASLSSAAAGTKASGGYGSAASAGKPGPADLAGQDGVALPSNGWLESYETKHVKGTSSGKAYLRWEPSQEGRQYKRYVAEGEEVTVLAREGEYSLVKTKDGRAGWVTSKLLA